MINFCTLFDSNYLARGLALHASLQSVCPSFHLYVVAFDDAAYTYLSGAGLPHLTPIALGEFEDPALLAVKPDRGVGEYCWTCTPSVILYCIRKYGLPNCTYLDADMIFYHDPQILLDERGDRSVIISEHRYSDEYAKAGLESGIYCVQFMYFANDEDGMTALVWWRERCLEWCYDRLEDGKFGDQKYLDDWTRRFRGVHVMQHPGGGLAPWNLQQYTFKTRENKLFVQTLRDGREYPAVFFHFHGLKFYTDGKASLCSVSYDVGRSVRKNVYVPYLKDLLKIGDRLDAQGLKANYHGARGPAPTTGRTVLDFLVELLSSLRRRKVSPFRMKNYNFAHHYHIYKLNNLR
jgi:hypothetical protein